MANIKTRTLTSPTDPGSSSAKNSALTHGEMDSNLLLLNNEKLENTTDDFVGELSIKGSGGSARGSVRLYDNDDSAYVDLKANATITSQYTFTFPPEPGTNGFVLKTTGTGDTFWAADASGTTADSTTTFTNKTIDLTDNTLTGTTAQFNTALSDGSFTTLAGTETLTNKTLTSPVLNTGVSGTAILDEDNMASNSATQLATQQSIKAYVDSTVAATNEVVEDTTPQLGGDLDVNGQSIVSTASGQIILAPDSGADTKIRSNVVQLGQTNTNTKITTNGTADLTLNTNDSTDTGEIVIRDGANQNIEITPNGTGELNITSNIKQSNGKIIEQYGGETGLFIHDQSEGGYTTSSFSSPAGMLAGPGIHIDSAGQFQYPSLVLRNNSVSGYPYIWAAKARPSGGTDYSTDAYMNNDEILFRFYGAPFKADATSGQEYFTAGADCNFKASENHSNGNLGCKIEMATINNGATSTTTKLTINDDIQAHTAIRLDEVSAPTNVTDKGFIYAKDVTGTAEVFVMDAAGNETQISPHNAEGEWQYFSKNVKTGKTVRINMEAMIRDIEQLTGKTYIENE